MKQEELKEIKNLLESFSQKYEGKLEELEGKIKNLQTPSVKPIQEIKIPAKAKKVTFIIQTENQQWKFDILL